LIKNEYRKEMKENEIVCFKNKYIKGFFDILLSKNYKNFQENTNINY